MNPKTIEMPEKTIDEDSRFFLPDLTSVQSIFVLVVATELMVLVLVLYSGSLFPFSWEELALTSLFMQWVVLSCALVLGSLRHRLSKISRRLAAVLVYGVILLVTLVFSVMAHWVLADSLQIARGGWAAAVVVFGKNLTIGAILGFFFLKFLLIQAELNEKQRSELEHRLQALQSRIRPHFLFNSMNSIASLIESDPETAETLVLDLSELFRASLNEVGNLVTFKQEVELCKRYMNIESLRLGSRLELRWSINANTDDVSIPLLTLQPLLENAIYHGVQAIAEGGFISVGAEVLNDRMEVTVTNSYQPVNDKNQTTESRGNRMALDNIKNRLLVLHGDSAKLMQSGGDDTYQVVMTLPAVKEKSTD